MLVFPAQPYFGDLPLEFTPEVVPWNLSMEIVPGASPLELSTGVVLGIVPWSFPQVLSFVVGFAICALLSGLVIYTACCIYCLV